MTLETHNGDLSNSFVEFEGRHIRAKKTIHGTLVRVSGGGVLLLGDSGTGKSDLALELVSRGHQLVADDSVEVHSNGHVLCGRAPKLLTGVVNIRELGLIKVDELFGPDSVSASVEISFCIELSPSEEALEAATKTTEILGVKLPTSVISVSQARNLALIIETAAKLFRKNGGSPKTLQTLAANQN